MSGITEELAGSRGHVCAHRAPDSRSLPLYQSRSFRLI